MSFTFKWIPSQENQGFDSSYWSADFRLENLWESLSAVSDLSWWDSWEHGDCLTGLGLAFPAASHAQVLRMTPSLEPLSEPHLCLQSARPIAALRRGSAEVLLAFKLLFFQFAMFSFMILLSELSNVDSGSQFSLWQETHNAAGKAPKRTWSLVVPHYHCLPSAASLWVSACGDDPPVK